MTTTPGRHADDDTVALDADPFSDDLTELLRERAPRKLVTRTTTVLAALLLLVAGFAGGAQLQKHWGKTTTKASNPFASLGGFPVAGASGFPGFGGVGAATTGTGAATTGTVKLVDGDTVYIQTADGRTVTVKTTSATAVKVSQSGSLKDLKAGASVSVDGSTGGDGAVTATTITRTK